jgi:hypothetical protein
MREDFQIRRREVEMYFDFIEKVDSSEYAIRDKEGKALFPQSERNEIIKTFKANGFLLLYNLMESTVKNAVEAIYDEMRDRNVHFDACRVEVRRIILANLRRRDVDKVLPDISTIAVDVIATTFRKQDVCSGTVDARAIRNAAKAYGFPPPSGKSDELLTVKSNRNDLAHGNKSFADVGRDYDVQRLQAIKREVIQYLVELIQNVDAYISNQSYLAIEATAAMGS